jgi:hypothetical protein
LFVLRESFEQRILFGHTIDNVYKCEYQRSCVAQLICTDCETSSAAEAHPGKVKNEIVHVLKEHLSPNMQFYNRYNIYEAHETDR